MPSVFEKEERLLKKVLTLVLVSGIAWSSQALVITLNGKLCKEYASLDSSLFYFIPDVDKIYSGISLGELFPLMVSVEKLIFHTKTDTVIITNQDFAEQLFNTYAISHKGSCSLLIDGKLLEDVYKIDIIGERIAGDNLEVWISWEGTDDLKKEIARFARHHQIKIKRN